MHIQGDNKFHKNHNTIQKCGWLERSEQRLLPATIKVRRIWTKDYTITLVRLFSPQVDKSGCFPTQRVVIVLLYFCQCFIGYLPCGGKLGCSAGNNRVASRQLKFLPMFYRLSPLWGEIGLFGGEQYRCCSVGNNRVVSQQRKFWQSISIILLSHE
jgi:hypothetical protein